MHPSLICPVDEYPHRYESVQCELSTTLPAELVIRQTVWTQGLALSVRPNVCFSASSSCARLATKDYKPQVVNSNPLRMCLKQWRRDVRARLGSVQQLSRASFSPRACQSGARALHNSVTLVKLPSTLCKRISCSYSDVDSAVLRILVSDGVSDSVFSRRGAPFHASHFPAWEGWICSRTTSVVEGGVKLSGAKGVPQTRSFTSNGNLFCTQVGECLSESLAGKQAWKASATAVENTCSGRFPWSGGHPRRGGRRSSQFRTRAGLMRTRLDCDGNHPGRASTRRTVSRFRGVHGAHKQVPPAISARGELSGAASSSRSVTCRVEALPRFDASCKASYSPGESLRSATLV